MCFRYIKAVIFYIVFTHLLYTIMGVSWEYLGSIYALSIRLTRPMTRPEKLYTKT
jgi:hypothetical protein